MASSIDSCLKLNLNKLKFSQMIYFMIIYYVIISSNKYMIIAAIHMAVECLLELQFEFINGLDFLFLTYSNCPCCKYYQSLLRYAYITKRELNNFGIV